MNRGNLRGNPFGPDPIQSEPFSNAQPQTQSKSFPSTLNNSVTSKEDILNKEYERLKQFNSSKTYLRLTSDKVPNSSALLQESYLPIGLMINSISSTEEEMTTVSFGNNAIPRCSSCRSYINPFVNWSDNGNTWSCNLCKKVNQTPEYYYSPLKNNTNERNDMYQRKELHLGSVEFIAGSDYMRRPPMAPAFVFIIDVSIAASQNKFLYAVIESIKDIINSNLLINNERTKVALITYDSHIHFYNLNQRNNQNQILVVPEDDIFIPTIEDDLVVNLNDSRAKLLSLLDLIPTLYSNNNCKDSNKMISAVKAAKMLMKSNGGKFLIFNSSVSIINTPFVKKENSTVPKDQQHLTPSDDRQICKLAIDLTNENICCDLFLSAENYTNLITLNELSSFTNGNIFFYKNFRIDTQYKALYNQIRKVLTNRVAWESVLRTRFSTGWKVTNFITPILISNDDLMVMPTLDSDQSYVVTLDFSGSGNTQGVNNQVLNFEDKFFYIQSALLYSHSDGTRRIRVHNTCVPITSKLNDLYDSVDVEALGIYYLKLTVSNIFKTKNVTSSVLTTENMYKNIISTSMSVQNSLQKEIPTSLIYLPLYILGIIKNRVCCKDEVNFKFDVDMTNYLRVKILKFKFYDVIPFIYPRIYNLTEILTNENIGEYDENGDLVLPNVINTFYSSFENDGVYLIDNGILFIIYIRLGVLPVMLNSLFNTSDLSNISFPIFEDNFFENPDSIKQKLINIIEYLRNLKTIFQNLYFSFEGTDTESIIKEYLVEDNLCKWYAHDYHSFFKNTVENRTTRPILK